eukprot:TRINITY_DN55204_c0_g1_i1.p1 TRINITY_DN55204_c0_g1~~TRINITY_DN55204_c0_g1_i1.p1  ORF type:complete len:454 (+),score=84.97 TRINITY_DN55204_c0_g1_i1:86-1363(+)
MASAMRESPDCCADEDAQGKGGRRVQGGNLLGSGESVDPEHARPSRWKVALATLATILVCVDDEWLWIPGVAYGLALYLWKQTKRAARSIATVPPACVATGAGAALVARAGLSVAPLSAVATPAAGAEAAAALVAARDAMLHSPGGLVAPLSWGLRLGIFTAVQRRWMLRTEPEEAGFLNRASLACAAGAWAELWARFLTAPFTRIAEEVRAIEGSAASAARRLYTSRGLLPFWEGMPPVTVEVPHMALLLGCYATARDTAWRTFSLEWDPNEQWWHRALPRAPIDALCGGLAAAVAHGATHNLRQTVDDRRASGFHKAVGGTTYVSRPSASVPLRAGLAVRTLHGAIFFPAYGAILSAVDPARKENGFRGWGEIPPAVNRYGAPLHGVNEEDDSFWGFFGVLQSRAPVDHSRRSIHNKRADSKW